MADNDTLKRWLVAATTGVIILLIAVIYLYFGRPGLEPPAFAPSCPAVTSPPIFLADPASCLGVPSGEARQKCLSIVKGIIDSAIQTAPAEKSPDYVIYSQNIAAAAAIQNDISMCRKLSTELISPCETRVPLLKAALNGNPLLCSEIKEQLSQIACYMDVLGQTNPPGLKEFQAKLGKIVLEGVKERKTDGCSAFSEEFLRKECERIIKEKIV